MSVSTIHSLYDDNKSIHSMISLHGENRPSSPHTHQAYNTYTRPQGNRIDPNKSTLAPPSYHTFRALRQVVIERKDWLWRSSGILGFVGGLVRTCLCSSCACIWYWCLSPCSTLCCLLFPGWLFVLDGLFPGELEVAGDGMNDTGSADLIAAKWFALCFRCSCMRSLCWRYLQ